MWPPAPGGTWVLDLDGVVWLTGRPIPGADSAVAALRGAGVRVLFATNNSATTMAELRRRLADCGITVDNDDLLSSAQVAAGMLVPGSTAVVLGEDGVVEALRARGVHVVTEGPADAVVVGWTRNFTFERVARASAAVRAGARLIGTNADPTYPTPDGLVPGGGAILAAVATASDTQPEIAGKPNQPTAEAIMARIPAGALRVMVGDRPTTDGVMARQLGVPFALVLTGVTRRGDVPADSGAAVVVPDLAALVHTVLDPPLR